MTDVLARTAGHRRRVADLLETLEPVEWAHPTLCGHWNVHVLAAHLTLGVRVTPWQAVPAMVRSGFDVDRMIDRLSRARADRFSAGELVAELRETADSPRRAPGTTVVDPLVDILVHGQDLARPLGRPLDLPAPDAVLALDRVLAPGPWGGSKRTAGVRLVAEDVDWSHGTGPEVRGPAGDLLLVATGRDAGRPALSGPGLPQLA